MTQPAPSDPEVSVVIPCRSGPWVDEQLAAVFDQVLPVPFEVIVVVAAGTEDDDVVRRWATRRPDLVVRYEERGRGPSAARNLGATAARGSTLVFCDADDLVAPGWLAALVAGLRQDDAVGGPAELHRLNASAVLAAYGDDGGVATGHNKVGGWMAWAETYNLAVDRGWFERLGGFDEGLRTAEDRDFSLRLQQQGGSLGWAAEAVVHRRLRATTRDQVRQAYAWARGEPRLYARHRAAGMPPSDPAWRAWARLTVRSPRLLDADRRSSWLRIAAYRVGRLVGSIEARAWYP